jgi:hypothetical protein
MHFDQCLWGLSRCHDPFFARVVTNQAGWWLIQLVERGPKAKVVLIKVYESVFPGEGLF